MTRRSLFVTTPGVARTAGVRDEGVIRRAGGRLMLALAAATVLLAAQPASAQTPAVTAQTPAGTAPMTAAQSQSVYERDRAVCEDGSPDRDKAACLREAASAREARSRGLLSDDGSNYAANAAARCGPLSGDERRDCLDRARGGGNQQGTVSQGGILRESVTRDIGAQPSIQPVEIPDRR